MMNNYLLIGNPNVGKTTIFNGLTNSVATVGNYSGVTVEKKFGKLDKGKGTVIDLPGIYSIVPSTIDEGVTTNVLINEDVNGIINVCDISSLTRHLHLTIQLIEYGSPTAIILNFTDEFKASGRSLNYQVLESILGVPVLGMTAIEGIDKDLVINSVNENVKTKFRVDYGILESYITEIKSLLPHNKLKRRFLAIAMLEGNEEVAKYLETFPNYAKIVEIVKKCNYYIESETKYKSSRVLIFDCRKKFIKDLLDQASYTNISPQSLTKLNTTKIDKYLTTPLFGIPIFIAVLILIYYATFNVIGNRISDLLDGFFNGVLDEFLLNILNTIGITGMFEDLLINGIYAGTTSVLVFLPQVVILFLFLTILESIGYLSRVCVLFDGALNKVGLSGKSIIPLITGIGCNVPAIMATRVIDSKKERLITLLTIPFMSCSARIPIYVVFASAFFESYAFIAMLFLQFGGIVVVMLVAKILNESMFKNDVDYFALELPPFRKPQGKYVLKVTYNKGKSFIRNVTKFVAIGTIIIWFLTSFSFKGYNVDSATSFMETISNVIAPIFKPLGFGTWQATSSLISGFMAKELVVSSMAIIYGVGENSLGDVLQTVFTLETAISFVVFNALYIPCIATVGAVKKETDSWKWTGISLTISFVVAYIFAFVAYIIANLIF